MNDALVAIQRCETYDVDTLKNVILQTLENTDFPNLQNKTVFLKPNILSDAKPQDCITTNPEFLRAVIRICKDKGASKILVGDSPGLAASGFEPKNCQISKICKEEEVTWVDFFENAKTIKLPNINKKLLIAQEPINADVLITLPKFKTHQLMYTTGAVKNLFGLVPGLHKSPCHLSHPSRESFAKVICSIYEYAKPSFAIMDAIIGMEGPGPANGRPKNVGLVIASNNCAALDYAQALIMGYNPNSIPILNELKKRNLLPHSINYPLLKAKDLVIENYDRIKQDPKTHFVKKLILPFFTRGLQKRKQRKEPKPIFTDKCIKCKRCMQICPAKALSFENNKINVDYNKCIRCYCCHELCPVDAISIDKE